MDQMGWYRKEHLDPDQTPGNTVSEKKSRNQRWSNQWSSLPDDLLRRIGGKLHFVERQRISGTCKAWELTLKRYSWLLCYPVEPITIRLLRQFKLYEPGNSKPYLLKKDFMEKGAYNFIGAKICTSKFGWVLFRKNISVDCSFFLYSPFAEENIKLPYLYGVPSSCPEVAFSSVPTSPNCVIFLLYEFPEKVGIYSFQIGQREWKEYILSEISCGCGMNHGMSIIVFKSLVFLNGMLYCLFTCGEQRYSIASINIVRREWRLLSNFSLSSFEVGKCRAVMLGSNGELLVINCNTEGLFPKFHIFKFDCSQNTLFEITTLEYQSGQFFIDWHAAFSVQVCGEERKQMINKVYNNKELQCRNIFMKEGKVCEDSITYSLDYPDIPWNTMFLFLDVRK